MTMCRRRRRLTRLGPGAARLTLVQESGTQFGFIVFVPVAQLLPCAPPAAGRCRTLVGLADAVFRITDLVLKAREREIF